MSNLKSTLIMQSIQLLIKLRLVSRSGLNIALGQIEKNIAKR